MSDLNENGVNWFAVMWDCNGLEAVQHIPDAKMATFARLKNEKPPELPNLLAWELRARYNMQRHYEIYLISVEPGIGEQDIRDMFDADPQYGADLIRSRGQKWYSDRATEKVLIK